jgi:hypothetical protein
MRKHRTPTDGIAEMLAFYKDMSDRQKAASRDDPVLERHGKKAVAAGKQRQAPIGALLRTRKHRRRQCVGAA